MNKRILITGATGCVGRATAAKLRESGWVVRGLARTQPSDSDSLFDEFVEGLVENRDLVHRSAAGCHAVLHLASWVHRVPKDEEDHAALRFAIVDGTKNVAEAAGAAGALLLHASSTAVYGDAEQLRTEDSPTVPVTPYGAAKLEAERVVASTCPRSAIFRFTLVYGPYDRGNFLALTRAIERRRAFIVAPGSNRKSVVYVANLAERLARFIDEALNSSRLLRVWNVADPYAPTQREIFNVIAESLNRRAPPRVPFALLAAAAGMADAGIAVLGRQGRFADRVNKLRSTTLFSGEALDSTLRYRPATAFSESVRATVAWYLRNSAAAR